MKKTQASLNVLAMLLLTAVLIGLGLAIYKLGWIDKLHGMISVTMITLTFNLRGLVIKLLWDMYYLIFILLFFIMWIYGSVCRSSWIGAAYCIAVYAVITIVVGSLLLSMMSNIPAIELYPPPVKIGDYEKACGWGGATSEAFYEKVSNLINDCWNMYGRGKFDPLAGKTPPNPRTCFEVYFNMGKSQNDYVSLAEIYAYMGEKGYKIPMVYRGAKAPTHVSDEFKKGILVIKYGDNIVGFNNLFIPYWYDDECKIYGTPSFGRDAIYLCFIELDKSESCYIENEDVEHFYVCNSYLIPANSEKTLNLKVRLNSAPNDDLYFWRNDATGEYWESSLSSPPQEFENIYTKYKLCLPQNSGDTSCSGVIFCDYCLCTLEGEIIPGFGKCLGPKICNSASGWSEGIWNVTQAEE